MSRWLQDSGRRPPPHGRLRVIGEPGRSPGGTQSSISPRANLDVTVDVAGLPAENADYGASLTAPWAGTGFTRIMFRSPAGCASVRLAPALHAGDDLPHPAGDVVRVGPDEPVSSVGRPAPHDGRPLLQALEQPWAYVAVAGGDDQLHGHVGVPGPGVAHAISDIGPVEIDAVREIRAECGRRPTVVGGHTLAVEGRRPQLVGTAGAHHQWGQEGQMEERDVPRVETLLEDRSEAHRIEGAVTPHPEAGMIERRTRDRRVAGEPMCHTLRGHRLPALDRSPVVCHEVDSRTRAGVFENGHHVVDEERQAIAGSRTRILGISGSPDVIRDHVVIRGEAVGDGIPDRAGVRETVHEDDGRSRPRSSLRHRKGESLSTNTPFGWHAQSQPRSFAPTRWSGSALCLGRDRRLQVFEGSVQLGRAVPPGRIGGGQLLAGGSRTP